MSRVKIVATFLTLLICLPAGIIFLSPGLILTPLAKSKLADFGLEIADFEVSTLGINTTSIDSVVLISPGMRVSLSAADITYRLSDLWRGQIESVRINKLQIELRQPTTAPATAEKPPSVSALLESFENLPIESIALQNVEIISADSSFSLALNVLSSPLQIEGTVQAGALEDSTIDFKLQRSARNRLNLLAKLLVEDKLALESRLAVDIFGADLHISGTNTLYMGELEGMLRKRNLLPATTIFNNTLSLQSNFTLKDLPGSPSVPLLNIILDSPSSTLHVRQESSLGSHDLQLQLPINATGSATDLTANLALKFSNIYARWIQESGHFQAELHFDESELKCASLSSCELQSDWNYNLINWNYGDYSGDNLSLSAALNLHYSNDEIRLATESMQVTLPSIKFATDSAYVNRSVLLQLKDLELRAGDIISGGFNFSSEEFNLGLNVVELKNPGVSGNIQFEEDTLRGILALDLDQRLRLEVNLQHSFSRDTGDVVLELAAHSFSDRQALSSLLVLPQIQGDIVAGDIAGLATISWSKQGDQSWQFEGPVTFNIENLSGYFAESFFVGLNSNFLAEVTTPLGLRVANPLSATLASVDIGLPLSDSYWQYSFDTHARQITLRDFNTKLLDGKLIIPTLDYNPEREQNDMAVVLSDLNLESIVNMAEYPELQVDGLISGYLPFVLKGNNITIENGLVSALSPGGSIRYTPASPVPSSNQSLQLVNDALSNYQFQTMNTEVFYDTDGELLMQVQLQGNNPDMNNGQAINLNITISDNIPTLLKSLQAGRVISDELERVLQNP